MPLPSQTFSTIQQLLTYINTFIIPNGANEISGEIHNNVENALSNFIVSYTLNNKKATLVSAGGVVVLPTPITVITSVVPTSIQWVDNVQNEYYILNTTNSTIPLAAGFTYYNTSLIAKNAIPANTSIHIAKATNGQWIQVGQVGTGSGTSTVPSLYGDRYNKSSWVDLSDFQNNGTSVAVVNNQLAFTGGASDYSQWMAIPDGTCLEKWEVIARLTVSSNGSGLAIGSRSYYVTGTPRWLIASFNTSTGILSIGVHGTPGPVIVVSSSSSLVFSATDVLEITIRQFGLNAKASIRNVTTSSAAITVQYTYTTDPVTVTYTMPNTSYMAIMPLGGNFSVSSLQWNVLESRNAEVLLLGDSLLKGYYCTGFGSRFADLLDSFYTPTIVAAGGGDTTAFALVRVPEIINLAPKRVLILIGARDVEIATPSGTTIANYDSIVSQLAAAGIDVYHLVGVFIAALNQTPLVNHITSTYDPSKVINCYVATQQAGIQIFDNSHLNDQGELVLLDTTLNANKLGGGTFTEQNVIRNQTTYVQSGSFAIDGKGTLNGTDTQFQVLNQIVYPNTSTPLINLSTTWSTTGAPTALLLNVTDQASAATSLMVDLRLNAASVISVSKSGQLTTTCTVNQVQQIIKLPSSQTVTNPIFQIQGSTGTPWFNINTNQQWNIFIGIGVGVNNVTPTSLFSSGSANTIVGFGAFAANTTGNVCTAVGASALAHNTTGQSATAIGQNAATTNTTGTNITAIGAASLAFNTTGNNLTAVGQNSLRNNTTGIESTAIGYECLWSNSLGNGNVAIGAYAFAGVSQSTIFDTSQCIGIGYQVGLHPVAVGVNNILIGYQNNLNANLGTDNIMIGALQTTGSAISNTTLIGDNMSSSVSNVVGLGKSTQNVIIGTTAITADGGGRLQLPAGTATAGTAPLKLFTGVLNTTPEIGALEFVDDGTTGHLYVTVHVASVVTRVQIA